MAESRKQKALISVRVTDKFKKDLEKMAEEKGMTLPDFIRYVLTDYKENKLYRDTIEKISKMQNELNNEE